MLPAAIPPPRSFPVRRARKQFPSSKTQNKKKQQQAPKKTSEYKTNNPILNATFSQGPPQDGDPGRDGACRRNLGRPRHHDPLGRL